MRNPFKRQSSKSTIKQPLWDALYVGNIGWGNDKAGVEFYKHTDSVGGQWARHLPDGRLTDLLDEGRMGKHEGAEVIVLVFDRFNKNKVLDLVDRLDIKE